MLGWVALGLTVLGWGVGEMDLVTLSRFQNTFANHLGNKVTYIPLK